MNMLSKSTKTQRHKDTKRFFISVSLCLCVFVLIPGCTPPRAGAPVVAKVHGDDVRSRIQFQRQITDRRICTNDDAFHLVIAYGNQNDPCENYDQRVAWLRERKMLPAGFNRPADEAVTRGALAVAITRMLHIKGGVLLHALPQSERYATR